MTIRKGLPAKLAATDADDFRYDLRNLVSTNLDGSVRGGVTSPQGYVLSATASMNVTVAAFSAIAVRDGGAVLLANDGPVTVALAAAPASNTRIDVVYAKQNDASSTVTAPDANNTPTIAVVTGTASATPSRPAVPTGAVDLGAVVIPANVTATNASGVTFGRPIAFTAGEGSPVPFETLTGSATGLRSWTTPAVNQLAQVFADPTYSNNGMWVYSGSQWNPLLAGIRHMEFSVAANGIPSATVVTGIAYTVDNSLTTDSTVASLNSGTSTFTLTAGLYAVSFYGTFSATQGATRAFFGIVPSVGTPQRNDSGNGEDSWSVQHPNMFLPAGGTFQVQVFQSTGASLNLTGKLRITKIG